MRRGGWRRTATPSAVCAASLTDDDDAVAPHESDGATPPRSSRAPWREATPNKPHPPPTAAPAVTPAGVEPAPAGEGPEPPGTRTLQQLENETVRRALAEAGGNISVAARRLGISRNTIYRKLYWPPGAGR